MYLKEMLRNSPEDTKMSKVANFILRKNVKTFLAFSSTGSER